MNPLTDAPVVSVINETFARQAWPGEDPIGKRFTTPQTHGPVTVIGVVGDTKHYTATEPAVSQVYAAHYQVPMIFSSLFALTRGPEMAMSHPPPDCDLKRHSRQFSNDGRQRLMTPSTSRASSERSAASPS